MLKILFEGINKTIFYQLDCKFNSKGVLFMNKVIKVIHPIKGNLEGDVYTPKPKKKVAAYARVSTNYQDQINLNWYHFLVLYVLCSYCIIFVDS